MWLVTARDAPGGVRLGIDFGTTHTVAALGGAGAPQPLLFDASFLLPSAVYAETDGRLLVGQDAIRSARLDPTRFEPNPKRRIDEGRILLGSREYPVTAAIGAVLRRVSDEAARVAGALPAGTVLTYPASWAAQRKAILATAASEAGLPAVTLVPEPVAAASYFTTMLGRSVDPGGILVVYDFGGGTFDTSVLRRGGESGWEILAADGLPDVGGVDLDGAIVEHLARTVGGKDPALWRRLTRPESDVDRRRHRMLWDDVRLAKEQLSRTSSASLHVPLFDTDVHLTREEFERIARPYLERTVDLTASLLQRAGIRADRLAGVFPVGGSSRVPLAGTLLHQRLGIAPTLIDQPELVVALGGFTAATPLGTAEHRRVEEQPPAAEYGHETSASGAHVFDAPRPMSPPPGRDPIWPSGAVPAAPRPAATPPRRRRPLLIAGTVAVLLLVLIGANRAYQFLNHTETPTSPQSQGAIDAKPGDAQQTVPMNKTAWFAGWELAFGKASYDKTRRPTVQVTATAKNLGLRDKTVDIDATLAIKDSYVTGTAQGSPKVPGQQKTNVVFEFDVQQLSGSLTDAVLSFGDATVARTVIPLHAGKATLHQPRQVLGVKDVTIRDLRFAIKHCDLSGDIVTEHKQAPAKRLVLSCWLDAVYRGPSSFIDLDDSRLRLLLPDGTAASPMEYPIQNLDRDREETNVYYAFVVNDPPTGTYTLRFEYPHLSTEPLRPDMVSEVRVTVPATAPASPSASSAGP